MVALTKRNSSLSAAICLLATGFSALIGACSTNYHTVYFETASDDRYVTGGRSSADDTLAHTDTVAGWEIVPRLEVDVTEREMSKRSCDPIPVTFLARRANAAASRIWIDTVWLQHQRTQAPVPLPLVPAESHVTEYFSCNPSGLYMEWSFGKVCLLRHEDTVYLEYAVRILTPNGIGSHQIRTKLVRRDIESGRNLSRYDS